MLAWVILTQYQHAADRLIEDILTIVLCSLLCWWGAKTAQSDLQITNFKLTNLQSRYKHTMWIIQSTVKLLTHSCILPSIMTYDTKATGMPLCPLSDVVNVVINNQPFITGRIMLSNIIPCVHSLCTVRSMPTFTHSSSQMEMVSAIIIETTNQSEKKKKFIRLKCWVARKPWGQQCWPPKHSIYKELQTTKLHSTYYHTIKTD